MSRPTAIRARLELLDVGAADRVGALLVELRRVEPAHVVRLEDRRVEHAPMLRPGASANLLRLLAPRVDPARLEEVAAARLDVLGHRLVEPVGDQPELAVALLGLADGAASSNATASCSRGSRTPAVSSVRPTYARIRRSARRAR